MKAQWFDFDQIEAGELYCFPVVEGDEARVFVVGEGDREPERGELDDLPVYDVAELVFERWPNVSAVRFWAGPHDYGRQPLAVVNRTAA